MATTVEQRSPAWTLVLAPLALVALGWAVSGQGRWLEQEIFERMMVAFGLSFKMPAATTGSWAQFYLESAVLFFLAAAATLCGYKLAVVARIIVLVQLFVLSLLAQWALWQWGHVPAHSLGYFTTVFVGCLAGYGLRRLNLQRQRAEAQYYELLLRNRELTEAKLQLVKQDEVERRMLAADLHDQVLNDLKAVRHKLESYSKCPDPDTKESIKALLNQAMSEIREVMDSLCPSALEHLGLAAAIEDCLRKGAQRSGFKGRFRSRLGADTLESLSMVEQALLYRLVQESITNVCKHAQASTVRASLEMESEQLIIRVLDDGRGIDPDKLRDDSRGVRYMRQRADLIGATISWRAGENGKGCSVEIRMNLSGRGNDQSSGS